MEIRGDNSASLQIADHPTSHDRSKHYETNLFALREWIKDGKMYVEKVPSAENLADLLTKAVTPQIYNYLKEKMSLKS